MALAMKLSEEVWTGDSAEAMQQLAMLPDWLTAAAQSERVTEALKRYVTEFASGAIQIRRCKLDRLRLKEKRYDALYKLTIDGPDDHQVREVMLAGILTPPNIEQVDQESGGPFGTEEWRCSLPELRLDLHMSFEDKALESLPALTDAEQARALLERGILACSPMYSDIQIVSARPKVMRYKPGSRCTVLYQLEYDGASDATRNWPDLVVAKTYSKDKGQNAYEGMRKLWSSPLSSGDIVSIAEPLAYIPEHRALVQGPVRGDLDLKDLLRSALRAGTPETLEELHEVTRRTAAGLAALHHSGACHGETVTWADELAEIREDVEKLRTVLSWFADAVSPLLMRLEALAAETPAEPTLPTHRSFRPQQVLIHQGRVGFIDFDGFCLAEPALDIALFRATAKEIGINTSPSDKQKEFAYPSEAARLDRLAQLDTICDVFLSEYQRLAPISRQRVALWEALDLLTVVLRCWTKVKPHQLGNTIVMLESHLLSMGL
jgi:hypothetical protein